MGFQMADDFGGNNEPQAGQYHVAFTTVDDQPTSKKDGKLIDGIRIGIQILEGTVRVDGKCTEIGKRLDELFANPNETHKDGGRFARQKLTNLVIAGGLVDEGKRGSEVEIDWNKLVGRQAVVYVKVEKTKGKGKDGSDREFENAGIDGVNIYPVTDPRVAHVPKCPKALKLLGLGPDGQPPTAGNGAKKNPPAPNGNGNGAKPHDAKQPEAAAAGGVDLSDL